MPRPAGKARRPRGKGCRPARKACRPQVEARRPTQKVCRPAGEARRPGEKGRRPAGKTPRPGGKLRKPACHERLRCLTNSSSATGTGDARLDNKKGRNAGACSLERVVRPPAYRGPLEGGYAERGPQSPSASEQPGPKDKRATERDWELPARAGNVPGFAPPTSEKVAGLTISSSATEAGEEGGNHGKEPAASLCSLERVVRLPAYRGASGPPELETATPAGE